MNQVVFITVDCLRTDHVGCYGYERPTTPNIDSFAETATIYPNSYSNCPGTRWAFQSLHTGVSTLKINGLGIPDTLDPLAAQFSENGHTTGGFAVNGFVSRDYRYDTGFDTYYSIRDSTSQHGLLKRIGRKVNNSLDNEIVRENILEPANDLLRSTKTDDKNRFQPAHSDRDTVDQALQFVRDHQDEPYFLWVHLMDAHTPYGYWPEHLEAVRGDSDIEHTVSPGKEGLVQVGENPPQTVIDTYDAGIRSADEQIGRLLNEVSETATVVFTGDHGEEFGQFGDFHSASLYGTMTQVPIIVREDDLEGGRSEMPAQHLDIPPTLLYAAGIEIPADWEGKPLQTVDREPDSPLFYTLGEEEIAVRAGEWKYIEKEGESELYQVQHADKESTAVQNEEMLKELRPLVEQYRIEAGTAGAGQSELNKDDQLSQEVEGNLEDLGYL